MVGRQPSSNGPFVNQRYVTMTDGKALVLGTIATVKCQSRLLTRKFLCIHFQPKVTRDQSVVVPTYQKERLKKALKGESHNELMMMMM